MTTRLYLRDLLAPVKVPLGEKSAALPVGTFKGNSGDAWENRSLKLIKGSLQRYVTLDSLAQTAHQDNYIIRFVSNPLYPQTISAGPWTLAVATSEANLQANSYTVCSIYVWRPSTSSVVGYIYDSDTPLGVEWDTTEDGQVLSISGAAVTAQDGDLLVLEFWRHAVQGMATAYTQTLYYDGTTDVTDGTTSDAASYLEYSGTINLHAEYEINAEFDYYLHDAPYPPTVLLKHSLLSGDAGAHLINGFDAALAYSGAGPPTLIADPGSYSITGYDVVVLYNRLISSDPGSYSITGYGVGLLYNRLISSDAGSYSISGSPASTLFNRILNLEPSSYSISGSQATTLFNRLLNSESSSYSVIGSQASILFNRIFNLESSSYSITGSQASTLFNRLLNAASSLYSITGFDATLLLAAAGIFTLNAELGSYSSTGSSASTLFNRLLNSESSSYSITGSQASILFNRLLNSEPSSYSISGSPITTLYNRIFILDSGTHSITGSQASLLASRFIDAISGTYSISGSQSYFVVTRVLELAPGIYAVTGYSSTLLYSGVPPQQTLVIVISEEGYSYL